MMEDDDDDDDALLDIEDGDEADEAMDEDVGYMSTV